MRAGEYLFAIDGETFRAVVAGDVVALPDERWSMGHFSTGISVEWMLHSGRLPGSAARRRVLARVVVAALEAHRRSKAGT